MSAILTERIEDISAEDLRNGYVEENGTYTCAVCGERFERGVIYGTPDRCVDAERGCIEHVATVHGGMFHVLADLPRSVSGLTDTQRTVLRGIAAGRSDREIASDLGGKTESTVRNHRFQFRKRRIEAQILLAITDLATNTTVPRSEEEFVRFPTDMPDQDDRVVMTTAEARTIVERYTDERDGLTLKKFPRKQKEKLAVLRRIIDEFDIDRRYTWKEVDQLLSAINEDYVTIRRYLIDYRFLHRTDDGNEYWVSPHL